MSETLSNSSPPADASALLGKLLSNPDLLRNLSATLGASRGTESAPSASADANGESAAEGISRVLSNPEMMAKLPDVMKMLAPMMQQMQPQQGASVPSSATPSKGEGFDRRGCRNDLLIALKPFLSPERCRAIDMLLGLSRLGDVLQKMI